MYWQEKLARTKFVVPDDVQDLAFRIQARCLPIDHAHALSGAILNALPWMRDEPDAGLQLIHVAESGNGWFRPQNTKNGLLQVSRRTRMYLRLPKDLLGNARTLTGQRLDVGGYDIVVGEAVVKPLNPLPTLFSRYIIVNENENEGEFVEYCVQQLEALGVQARKLISGRQSSLTFPEGLIHVRSLLLADLEPGESVTLQQRGLGPGRMIGCGLFIPHKGIAAVISNDN